MRRWLIRHEQKTSPFVVTDQAVSPAEFPRLENLLPYLWKKLPAGSDTPQSGTAQVDLKGRNHTVHYQISGSAISLTIDGFYYRLPFTQLKKAGAALAGSEVRAEIPGRIVKVLVKAGDSVKAGQPLVVQEAMKMEITLKAPADSVVAEVLVSEGSQVEAEALLLSFVVADKPAKG